MSPEACRRAETVRMSEGPRGRGEHGGRCPPLGLAHSRCSETLAPDLLQRPFGPRPTFPGPQEAITCRRGAGRRPHLCRRLSAAPSLPSRGARRLRVLPPAAPSVHDPSAAPGLRGQPPSPSPRCSRDPAAGGSVRCGLRATPGGGSAHVPGAAGRDGKRKHGPQRAALGPGGAAGSAATRTTPAVPCGVSGGPPRLV